MKIASLSLLVVSFFISCQKDGKPSEKISAEASDSVAAAIASDYETSLKNMTTPVQSSTVPAASNPVATTTQQPTKPGMNPPHGQAGHRCDIPVGAPLNSKPAAPANTVAANTSQNNKYSVSLPNGQNPNTEANAQNSLSSATVTPMPTPTKVETTAPGMQGKPNPKHGEEGHRCDIPVGVNLP